MIRRIKLCTLLPVFGLAILLAGCQTESTTDPAANAETTPPDEVLAEGNYLPFTGEQLPAVDLTTTTRTIVPPEVEESQLNAVRTTLQKTIPFEGEPRQINFGKGNFLPITKLPVGEPTKFLIEPTVVPALPFQNVMLEKLSYQVIGLSQGLNSAFVTSAFQDSRGYYWIGGRRGLTRYDGQTFYFYPFANEGQHRGVGAITEDLDGNIWMSFGSFGGLIKFDGHHFYEYQEGAGLNLGETYLGIIHVDQKGNIWLKSETKVVRFDGETFTCFPYRFQDLKNLNVVIKENEKGEFWLSGLGGVSSLIGDEMKYYAIEEQSENNLCHPIMEDERGLLVVTGTGITVLKDDQLKVYPSPFIDNNSVRNTLALGNDFILATDSRKTVICSLSDSTLTLITEQNPVFAGAFPLYVDRNNTIWFGTTGKGAICYNPVGFKHFKFKNRANGGPVSSLLESRDGSIWFGSHGFGLFKYDGRSHRYFSLLPDWTNVTVRSLLEDHAGNIWAGTVEFGLFKIEPAVDSGYTITRYNCFDGDDYSVFALAEDAQQNIWIGTRSKGLLKYNGDSFTQYYSDDPDPINSSNNIRSIIVDQHENLWIGSQNGGLRKLAAKDINTSPDAMFTWYTQEDGLSSNQVVSLLESSEGILWVGTIDGGVNRFDGNRFSAFTREDGLSSNAIWTISEDAQQNIWLGADNCLNVLIEDPNSNAERRYVIKTYCNLDGLEGAEFYANAAIRDQKDQLWWGTDQMAIMLAGTRSLVRQEPLLISLEQINIENNNVRFRSLQESAEAATEDEANLSEVSFDSVLPFVNCPTNLELPPELNDLSFAYSTRGAKASSNLQFSFLMEGVDKNWSLPTSDNTIDYRGLSAGTYTLQARVSEVRGLWSEPHVYTFKVLPFWWETWWATMIWVALGLLLLYGIYRMVDLRRREQEEASRLREIETLKSRLYANITHEFRTPLTLIMGMNEQIADHDKETSVIRRNSQKLLHQINQLLDTAKLEAGGLTLNLVQRDVVDYLRILSDSFQTLAESKQITLTFYSEESELRMDFDEEKLQEVVYNLLSNAIKFTNSGGQVIFHVRREGDRIQLKIKDSGIGMSEAQLEKIFDRFYQVNNPKATARAGTGIGLALTKDLIGLMNGEIAVRSELDEGAEFTITLPITNNAKVARSETIRKLPGLAVETEVPTAANPEVKGEHADRAHLLIIEDNPEIANYLTDIFRNHYLVHVATNGKLGIDKAFEVIPDAIISDVNMPEKDGYMVTETLKGDSRTSHIPIILLTANTAQHKKLEGYIFGADAYITKPFQREELEIRLQNLIDQRKELQKYYLSLATTTSTETETESDESESAEERFLRDLRSILETHFADAEFGVPELAEKAGASQMQVYRKLKALTAKTPTQFIRSFRLNKAIELLEKGELNVSEVAYEVGFSDPNYFSRTFHKEFGRPPGSYFK